MANSYVPVVPHQTPTRRYGTPLQSFRSKDMSNGRRTLPRLSHTKHSDNYRMGLLVAAAYHNMICSPLYNLLEELVLSIKGHLDVSDVQCIRGASRLFLRLYCSQESRATHNLHMRILGLGFPRTAGTLKPEKSIYIVFLADVDESCKNCHHSSYRT